MKVFSYKEERFIIRHPTIEAFTKLNNTVDATDEDQNCGGDCRHDEESE